MQESYPFRYAGSRYPEKTGKTRTACRHLLAVQDADRDPFGPAVVHPDQTTGDPGSRPPDRVVSRAHAPADGELDRPDGVGLVHLPAADLCDPDPGLVLQKVRRDGGAGRKGPSLRPLPHTAETSLPHMRGPRIYR